ncbi:MAG: glycosyltransferase family 1 protein [Caldilineaceae bacterium]
MTSYILDTRTATTHFPGIGRYVANLERELPGLLNEEEALVLLEQEMGIHSLRSVHGWGDGEMKRIEVAASPFSLSQQWQVPKALRTFSHNPQSAIRNPQFLYHSPYYLMPYRPSMPTILTFYDVIPLLYPEYVSLQARLLFRLTTQFACRAASHIVSISDASSRDLTRYFGVPANKITTTSLAPDPRFQPQQPAECDRVRQKYNLPEHFILYFGINKPHKNLVSLIDAYAKLIRNPQSTIRNIPLVIAGAWDARYPEAKQHAASLGDNVRFLGRIDDAGLPGLYASATVFVFPSKYEGFGLPVLEAMACGTPVACSNTSSLPEVAGDAALLFDPTNVGEISAAIEQLVSNEGLQKELRQRGLNQAARFTWRKTAEKTLDVYRTVLK